MELEKKQTLTPPYKRVSETGIQEIHNYLRTELGRETYLYFPLSWSWEWLATHGDYRGKLPNRLAHLVKTRYDIKLIPKQRSMIGNIARKHLLVDDSYTIDFTDTFDWEPGDFGDYGSCFWAANRFAREVMEEEGVIAIRFYDEDGKGFGRAWLYEVSSDAWVLFNAYGLECPEVASILTMKLEEDTGDTWDYEELSSLWMGPSSLVYINAQPQVIYRDGHHPGRSIDLDWDVPYRMCISCDDWYYEDDIYYDEDSDGPICSDCYEMLLDRREAERLAELEERLEYEMGEDFRSDAAQAEAIHVAAQETIRNNIIAQLVAGQLCLGVEYQVNLFYG